jgi:Holliday junction resolvase RusA-like endonuclease
VGDPLIIDMPGPPRGKGRPRFARATGRAFTDARTRSYEGDLRAYATEAMRGREIIAGPVLLKMVAIFPVPTSWSRKKRAAALAGSVRPTVKPDLDNILKLTDALNGVVWRDDAQVVTATQMKVYGERPALRLEVIPIGGSA